MVHQVARRLSFSWLALLETIIASGLAVWIAFGLREWRYVLLAVTIAPLLLLRNSYSVVLGRIWMRKWLGFNRAVLAKLSCRFNSTFSRVRLREAFHDPYQIPKITILLGEMVLLSCLCPLLIQLSLGIGSLVIKVVATIVSFSHPVVAVSSIPRNWWFYCFESNVLHNVEIVPGAKRFPLADDVLGQIVLRKIQFNSVLMGVSFYFAVQFGLLKAFGSASDTKSTFLFVILFVISLAIALLAKGETSFEMTVSDTVAVFCATSYRWTIKSTSFVWLPLIWIAHDSFGGTKEGGGVLLRLKMIRQSIVSRVKMVYGLVSSTLLTTKYVFLFIGYQFIPNEKPALSIPSVLAAFLQPMKICLWQLAAILAVIISLLMFSFADKELIRRQNGNGIADSKVIQILGWATLIRDFFALYNITCIFLILYQLAGYIKPFPIEWRVLP